MMSYGQIKKKKPLGFMVGNTFTISAQRCTEIKTGTLKKKRERRQTGTLSCVIRFSETRDSNPSHPYLTY